MKPILQFGIETLDRLLGRHGQNDALASNTSYGLEITAGASTSVCIVGPDGTGKSVLALHLASRYAAQIPAKDAFFPAILYASTDLNFEKAASIWKSFGLDYPDLRAKALGYRSYSTEYRGRLLLERYRPFGSGQEVRAPNVIPALQEYLDPSNPVSETKVAFVDLESNTAGDDWGFLTRLIASLDTPDPDQHLFAHLVIIDAIEGLQMMGGERDASGEERSRRSRIAQLIRAGSGKCHLAFIVEEPRSDERFPEQFVADAVIRLRSLAGTSGYMHRTLEVEKVRAQTHIRGQHAYTIRGGGGSTTWRQINPDDRPYSIERPQPDVTTPPATPVTEPIEIAEDADEPVSEASSPHEENSLADLNKTALPVGNASLAPAPEPSIRRPAHRKSAESRIELKKKKQKPADALSYMLVYPSLDFLSRQEMQKTTGHALDKDEEKEWGKSASSKKSEKPAGSTGRDKLASYPQTHLGFGIPYLDTMLARSDNGVGNGLPACSVTGVIGTSKTHKSRLGRAFLSQCFGGLHALLDQETDADWLAPWTEQYSAASVIKDQDNAHAYQQWRLDAQRVIRTSYTKWAKRIVEKQQQELEAHHAETREKRRRCDIAYQLAEEEFRKSRYFSNSPKYDPAEESVNDAEGSAIAKWQLRKQELEQSEESLRALKMQTKALEAHAQQDPGVAVLITTEDFHSHRLASRFYEWTSGEKLKEFTRDNDFTQQIAQAEKDAKTAQAKAEAAYAECAAHPELYAQLWEEAHSKQRYLLNLTLEPIRAQAAMGFAESRTICRRLEVHTLTPAILFHIIKEAVEEAKRILFGADRLNQNNLFTAEEFQRFSSIRVVIDNWSTIVDTYPAVRDDPLFLPYLFFYLRRQGVTTLVLESHTAGDGQPIAQSAESRVAQLADHTLLTWNVRFHGRRMVAISPLTAFSPGQRSVTRELVRSERSLKEDLDIVRVDPHLELYSHLLTGEPSPVPLRVRLFTEGPTASEYAETLNVMLKDLFPTVPKLGAEIVSWTPSPFEEHGEKRYERLRYICSLHSGNLDHTVVWQVDEFWAMGGSRAILPLNSYFAADTHTRNPEEDSISDPYDIYRRSEGIRWGTKRQDFFHISELGYKWKPDPAVGDAEFASELLDRIPYTWDFGFLMCRSQVWERAFERKLRICKVANPNQFWTVREVWDALNVSQKVSFARKMPIEIPSWRVFLEACAVVAKSNSPHISAPTPAFDLSLLTPESVSCLVMEMWMSEMYQQTDRAAKSRFIEDLGVKRTLTAGKKSLKDWLQDEKHVEALYKAFLLLFEVIDTGRLVDPAQVFSYNIRDAEPQAVAVRHWYKTASKVAQTHDPANPIVPIRLPGHFSMRGDWFLALASGSRSARLGERALDLMTSRRTNIHRLQVGIGLPTRKLLGTEAYKQLRTCLYTNNEQPDNYRLKTAMDDEAVELKAGEETADTAEAETSYPVSRRRSLLYSELCLMGASQFSNVDPFFWLWRSRLASYDRHTRIWHKWICRLLLKFEDMRRSRGPDWKSGFEVYDWVSQNTRGESNNLIDNQYRDTNKEFLELIILLKSELEGATPLHDDSNTV